MALVYATPYSPEAPPKDWTGMEMSWTGWDGSEWNLTSAEQGAVMMSGVRGMTMPPVQHYTTSYASVAGARWRGHTVNSREVFWPIQIYTDQGSSAWVERDRAFWKTMRPDKTGVWTVRHPSGELRHLDCRFVDDGEATFSHDPILQGWSNYGITLSADQPFWRAAPIRREWSDGTPSRTFFPTVPGEGFRIGSSKTLATSKMPNPGDVDAYPVWEVKGPATSAQVGVAGKLITIPFTIASNQVLVIDTAPTVQAATLYNITDGKRTNPVDKTALLGSVNFAPVPASATTNTSLSVSGSGRVALILTPLYLRAW